MMMKSVMVNIPIEKTYQYKTMLTHIWAHRETVPADLAEYASNVLYVFAVFIPKNGKFNHDFSYQ